MSRQIVRYLFSLAILTISVSRLYAEPFTLTIHPNGIGRVTDLDSSGQEVIKWQENTLTQIGRDSKTDEYPNTVYRSYAIIDPSQAGLPSEAYINNAMLTIDFYQYKSNYSMRILSLDYDPSLYNPKTNWDAIEAAPVWVAGITTTTKQSPSIGNFKSLFQRALNENSKIYVGFMSNQETISGTANSFTITLEGSYNQP